MWGAELICKCNRSYSGIKSDITETCSDCFQSNNTNQYCHSPVCLFINACQRITHWDDIEMATSNVTAKLNF